MKNKIHKAIRPKIHYDNPTLCIANLNLQDAHKYSRTTWKNVTCKKCLSLRKIKIQKNIVKKYFKISIANKMISEMTSIRRRTLVQRLFSEFIARIQD